LDPDVAEAHNAAVWRLAFDWFRDGEEDPTLVGGISAGDIAGTEVALSILLPAVRGALECNVQRRSVYGETHGALPVGARRPS
jgi:hypothetical protein